MSFLSRLFPNIAEMNSTSKDLKTAEKKVESRDKEIESLNKSIKVLRADHSDYKFYNELDKKRVNRTHESAVEDERDSSARLVRGAKQDADFANESADSAIALAIEKAGVDARKTVATDVNKLETDLSDAKVDFARADSRSDERGDTIALLQQENTNLRDILKDILKKVPDVTLDKFNINVEVPAAEVTVVTAGKQGGGKKDN